MLQRFGSPLTATPAPLVNVALHSEDFAWTTANVTMTSGQTDPLGGTSAYGMTESTDADATVVHQVIQGVANLQLVPYTFTLYVKALQPGSWIALGGNGGSVAAWYNISGGVLGTPVGGTSFMQAIGNGWFRCGFTYTVTTSTSNLPFYTSLGDGSVQYKGTGIARVAVWHPQLSLGTLGGQYVPSTASSVGTSQVRIYNLLG